MIHVALCGPGVTYVALCGSDGSKFQNMVVVMWAGEALKDTVKKISGVVRTENKRTSRRMRNMCMRVLFYSE